MSNQLDNLDDDEKDQLASSVRAVLGALPVVGPALSEAVTVFIPQQRHERIISYIRDLAERIETSEEKLRLLSLHARSDSGSAILEESMVAAAKAATSLRRRALSSVVAKALTQKELEYTQTSQILRIVAELGDGELLTLQYYSLPQGDLRERGQRERLADLHPQILRFTLEGDDATDEEREIAAYQSSYRTRLQNLGLVLFPNPRAGVVTDLGKLVLRSIEMS